MGFPRHAVAPHASCVNLSASGLVHMHSLQGAKAAGLSAAYINRDGRPYPGFYLQPDLEASSMTDLARQLDTCA